MTNKKTFAPIKNLHYTEQTHQGVVGFFHRDDGTFNIEANFGGRQAGMETDRESIVKLRDSLTEFLAATEPPVVEDPPLHMTLSDEAYDRFEQQLEQRPLSTNLAAQRLLRRKKPWSES